MTSHERAEVLEKEGGEGMSGEPSLLQMMTGAHRLDPDWQDALEAYVAADKARDKAEQAFEKAEELVQRREAELRAIYEHLTENAAAPAEVQGGTE